MLARYALHSCSHSRGLEQFAKQKPSNWISHDCKWLQGEAPAKLLLVVGMSIKSSFMYQQSFGSKNFKKLIKSMQWQTRFWAWSPLPIMHCIAYVRRGWQLRCFTCKLLFQPDQIDLQFHKTCHGLDAHSADWSTERIYFSTYLSQCMDGTMFYLYYKNIMRNQCFCTFMSVHASISPSHATPN